MCGRLDGVKIVLNKQPDEKIMLAGIFAFGALGILYLYVSAVVRSSQAPGATLTETQNTQTQNAEQVVKE